MRVQSLQEITHSMLKNLKQSKVLYWILCIQWTTQTVIYMLSGALLCFCKWAGWEFSTILRFNNHPASLREHHSQLNIQKSYSLTLRRNVFNRKYQFLGKILYLSLILSLKWHCLKQHCFHSTQTQYSNKVKSGRLRSLHATREVSEKGGEQVLIFNY